MLFHAVDAVERAILLPDDAPDVFVEFIAVLKRERALAILGAEYDVIKYLAVAGHEESGERAGVRGMWQGVWFAPFRDVFFYVFSVGSARGRASPTVIHIEPLRGSQGALGG